MESEQSERCIIPTIFLTFIIFLFVISVGTAAVSGEDITDSPEVTLIGPAEPDSITTSTSPENLELTSMGPAVDPSIGSAAEDGIAVQTSAAGDRGLVIPRDNRTLHVGETVAIGFREDHGGSTYEWDIVNGDDDQLLHTSTAEVKNTGLLHDARATSFRPTSPGEYEIRVTVDSEETHTVTIHVKENSNYLADMSRHELAQAYAPVLSFHPDEDFYPTRYEAYFENSDLMEHRYVTRLRDKKLVEGVTLLDIGAEYAPTHLDTRIDPHTEGDSEHAAHQRDVVRNTYPETAYASIHENVRFRGETYTAIGYWMIYIHDPKPGDAAERTKIAKHTGDQEAIFVLVDDQGNPEWVGAQQHFGGEVRAWERVETVDDNSRPVVHVAEGAHSNFFGPQTGDLNQTPHQPAVNELKQLYQQQYLCSADGGPSICDADGPGGPTLTQSRSAASYTDNIEPEYPGSAEMWRPKASGNIPATTDYEVTLMTGSESWSEFNGDIYRYPRRNPTTLGKGSFPQQSSLWENDTLYADLSLTNFLDSEASPREQREIHPYQDQVTGEISDTGGTTHSFNGDPDAKSIELTNDGLRPHEYVVTVTTSPVDSAEETTRQYSSLVEVGGVDISTGVFSDQTEIVPNDRWTTVPLAVEGDGPWEVDVQLSVYPETIGADRLEQRVELDRDSFQVEASESGTLSISDIVDGTAGGADTPRPVIAEITLEQDGILYTGPVYNERLDVTVGNESVDNRILISDSGAPGEYTLHFVPPEQQSAGDYNLSVDYEGITDEQADAISYGEGESTQLAASIQIDRSGSMGGIMSEARRGGVTFVEQANDEDYISVVSYASGSRVDQELTQLSDGRDDTIQSIESISAGGVTNIGAAMEDGAETLEDAPEGTIRAGIHMTDGQRNRGPSQSQIINNIVPMYDEMDACLYTIGFTDAADDQFMRDVAGAAECGEYRFAGEEGEVDSIQDTLQAVFSDIAGDVSDADTLASEEGVVEANETRTDEFSIDDSVSRFTARISLEDADLSGLVASNDTNTIQAQGASSLGSRTFQTEDAEGPITLVKPDGTTVDVSDPDVEVSVVGDSLIYRVNNPDSGSWTYEITNENADPAEYSVDLTGDAQIALDVSTDADTYFTGGDTDLTATLVGPDSGISGATVEATVTQPDGTTTTVLLEEQTAGIYAGGTDLPTDGEYMASVTADTGELSRVKTVSWGVEETASITVEELESPETLPGESAGITISVESAAVTDGADTLFLSTSDLTAIDGNATIEDAATTLDRRSIDLGGSRQEVTGTVDVPEETPPGEYRGTVRAFRADGSVVTVPLVVTVLEPATFELEVVDSPDSVEINEEFELDVEITNTGDVRGERPVLFSVTGGETKSAAIELDAGNSTTETFSTTIAVEDAEEYVAVVDSQDAVTQTPIEVIRPALFGVNIDSDQSRTDVEPGETVTIATDVLNVGDQADTRNVTVLVDGELQRTTAINLEPDESEQIEFTRTVSEADDGIIVSVVSDDDDSEIPLSVQSTSEDAPPAGDVGGSVSTAPTQDGPTVNVVRDDNIVTLSIMNVDEEDSITASLSDELENELTAQNVTLKSLDVIFSSDIDTIEYELRDPVAEPETVSTLDADDIIAYLPVDGADTTSTVSNASVTIAIGPDTMADISDPAGVVVYQHNDGVWEQSETVYEGDGEFNVTTESLSSLAIVVESTDESAADTETETETETEAPETTTESDSTDSSGATEEGVHGFGIAITCVTLLITIVIATRRNQSG